MFTIVNEGLSLAIVNKGLSLTIVNETSYFIKTIVFEKNTCKLYRMWEIKLLDIFLKNDSIVSTDALQIGFLSLLKIVNEGLSLMIFEETTSFIKMIV